MRRLVSSRLIWIYTDCIGIRFDLTVWKGKVQQIFSDIVMCILEHR